MRKFGSSIAGTVRLKKDWEEGSISKVLTRIHQVFQVVPGITSFVEEDEIRFKFFKEKILRQILKIGQRQTLIVTPSYFSYVRIRNELIRQEVDAAFVCEYSRDSEISRGRSRFFHGQTSILLYSGRAHFFRRYMMRGSMHVIFYSLPEYAHFYPEIVNMIGFGLSETEKEKGISCTVLLSQ